MGTRRRTIGRIVNEDLNYKSYLLKRRHLLAVPLLARFMAAILARLQSSRLICVERLGVGGEQQTLQQQDGSQGSQLEENSQHGQGRHRQSLLQESGDPLNLSGIICAPLSIYTYKYICLHPCLNTYIHYAPIHTYTYIRSFSIYLYIHVQVYMATDIYLYIREL